MNGIRTFIKRYFLIIGICLIVIPVSCLLFKSNQDTKSVSHSYKFGEPVDSLNQVIVYYNGSVGHVNGRNLSEDGYNYGLKYQCVEFVKRYYHDFLHHKMPDTWGNAKDFFDPSVSSGSLNKRRGLVQYSHPGFEKPRVHDLIIMDGTAFNAYGHVCIVSAVYESEIEIIQQNPGPNAPSRVRYALEYNDGRWEIDHSRILGWLRKE